MLAGKSSLLNALVGEERAIVCDLSGTTRDAVDTDITLPDGTKLTLIDTAGIRKRSKVADSKEGSETLSVDRALRAVRRADIAVLVVDASEGVTQQVRLAWGCVGRVLGYHCYSGMHSHAAHVGEVIDALQICF